MAIAFVCDKEDRQSSDDPSHVTAFVMRKCSRCDEYSIAGYQCETCEHEDVDEPDSMWGHGEGKCDPKEGA